LNSFPDTPAFLQKGLEAPVRKERRALPSVFLQKGVNFERLDWQVADFQTLGAGRKGSPSWYGRSAALP
jgi:hypothetical protein